MFINYMRSVSRKNKTRLFIDGHIFDDPLQGSRTYLLGIYSELIKKSSSVDFFFGAYNIDNIRREFGVTDNVHYIKYRTRNRFFRLGLEIPFLILKFKIEISHFQYISPLFKLSKEIVTIHDVLFLDYPHLFPFQFRLKNKILFKLSAKRADILLTVSEYSKDRISKHLMIEKNHIYVIANAVSEDFFKPEGELPDVKSEYHIDNYLLYVSRFEPRKNQLMLLKAFVELKLWSNNYMLVFIGSQAIPYPAFERYRENLPDYIKKSILLVNESYGNELKSFYRNCLLFVYPSFGEGFGIPPLEAVASNVSAICSNSTAMSDYKFLGDRLFNPDSPDELKEKLMKYLKDISGYKNHEVDYVRENFRWSDRADKFSELLSMVK
jgi:glycosyltransferase involved in cell wall biosynthesis